MLLSLLPGIRELRTPLSTGYLWLISLWLLIGDRLPKTQPAGGALAPAWRLGTYFGKAGMVVAVSFAAYLVGSFVELDPLQLWEHGGRAGWLTWLRNLLRHRPVLGRLQVFPISSQAGNDLVSFSEDDLGFRRVAESDVMTLMTRVMGEEQQIATRLQATNGDLFGKYDRLLAESAFRVNVAAPLAVLLLLALWRSGISELWEVALTPAIVLYTAMLFRQGVRRAIHSRDVIIQALIIGVVSSRTLDRLRSGSFGAGDAHPTPDAPSTQPEPVAPGAVQPAQPAAA